MAELDDKDRKKLDTGQFALPEERKYPIPDESHARNALARVAQHGDEEQQREVREHVHERYPDVGS
ncbi:hypothetical protein EV189_1869 [Motilibacter rhizosphaerae]|uniref:Uncharacterized protein n=1 Tax=Motilibacter rhizosphaerae TaxID=598652 RepID=A0A4Q7NSH9_9ACTN|nr:DUF6582 domain-containing protein [Motilibacter rhizosphaerae]RZS90086.1 hypothetical protein EV189_1869 [Motilibacter rhizosphaerae]